MPEAYFLNSIYARRSFGLLGTAKLKVSVVLVVYCASFALAQSGAPVSDDFNGTALNTGLWTLSAPAGGAVSVLNGHANLTVPAGSNHDAFVGGDNSIRILQNISNNSFDVVAKFDSSVSKQYEGKGILVQQNSGTYLRFEFASTGVETVVSANSVSGGVQQSIVQTTLSNGAEPLWLQVKRSGTTYTPSYSNDGVNYSQAGSFSSAIIASATGPYAWNYNSSPSQAPGFASAVDYFYNVASSAPVTATPTFVPPDGTSFSANLSVSIADNTPGATIHYTTDGSVPTSSSAIYTAPLTVSTTTTVKAFAILSGDSPSSVASASYTLSIGPPPGPPISDDFNGTSLDTTLWTASAPAGGTVTVANGHANLAAPGGSNHDAVVGGDNSIRILQNIANSSFDVEAKFDSSPTKQYQGEGILVQQNSGTYLRIEFSSNGSQTAVSVNSVIGGQQTPVLQKTVSNAAAPLWLQVQRTGNAYTVSYSNDGLTYFTAGTFSASITVSAIGPYAWNYNGNAALAPPLTAAVDYFHNLGGGSGINPPVISGISANASATAATIAWTTDEAATSKVQYGTTTSYGNSTSNSALTTNHSSTLVNLVCNSLYDYDVGSNNAEGQNATSANQTFTTAPCSVAGGVVSDNFDLLSLNQSLWTFVNPRGDGILTMNGTAATLNVPYASTHDAWTSGNNTVRLMQSISNSDFQVQVRFQSDVELGNQDEGILVQQDASHFLRFDLTSDGTSVRIFAAGIQGGSATTFVNNAINVTQAPIWLQLQRTGNSWVGKWSTDGVNFNLGAAFNYSMTVSSIGPYAGSSNATASQSPAFTAIVDYFFNVAKPISNQSGPFPYQAITVDSNPPSTLVEKALADIRGSGHLDPVVGFEFPSGGIYWYEPSSWGNLSGTWLKHTIVSNGNAYEDMLPLDVNNDGAVDIVASYNPPGSSSYFIVWFQNPRGQGGDPATASWTMHTVGTGQGENNLVLADIDGDGKMDIVTANFIFFQNSPTSWTQVKYNTAFRGIALLDIGSGKGGINLVTTLPNGTSTWNAVWFENPREHGGNARTGQWTAHSIGAGYPCSNTSCPGGDFSVATYGPGDLNGDGRVDVVMGQSEGPGGGVAPPPGGLVWFEAPQDRRNGTWIRHTIDANFIDTHAVRIADMDHNGTLDLIMSEQDQSIFRRVGVFYNDGAGNFTLQVLGNPAGHQTMIGDIQGAGSIDILNSGHGYFGGIHPLQIFLNPVK